MQYHEKNCLELNIFKQDDCFCSKLGLGVEISGVQSKNIYISDVGDDL